MTEKVKKFFIGAAKTAVVEVLRGYLIKRIKNVSPDDMISAIERDDTDLIGKLSEKDKKLLQTVAGRFYEHLDMLTLKNVFTWLAEDLPFYAGVIYGHPKGLKWLEKLLEGVRNYASQYAQPEAKPELILEELSET